jgi:hypothetical protein
VSFDLRLAHIPAANFGMCLDVSAEEANGNALQRGAVLGVFLGLATTTTEMQRF